MDYEVYDYSLFDNEESFLKNLLYANNKLIKNSDFKKYKMQNRCLMFFLNHIIDSLSSVSMLGCRNFGISLLGKLQNIINYYDNMIRQYEGEEKKIPSQKIDYIRYSIKNSTLLKEKDKNKYAKLLKTTEDKIFIENVKFIRNSLIDNQYFEFVSDELYNLLSEPFDDNICDKIVDTSNEYFSLLMDYIGISVFEIKRVIKDTFRKFFKIKKENIFFELFQNFAEMYNKYNQYILFVKMDKTFDEKLVTSLRQSNNANYTIFSKSGLEKKINEYKINNKTTLNEILEKYIRSSNDNNYFLSSTIDSKDIWYAIKKFRQNTLQPFIGSMLYSGIKVNSQGKYLIIERKGQKSFINDYNYYDDIFKPLSQFTIDYSDVFKRHIIDNSQNDINEIIDEAVQLLPYYTTSDSILTRFTNTWFALETLFRKASNKIVKSLEDYASFLVADRMFSGYIYVTATQISKIYKMNQKYSNNNVENLFFNYSKLSSNDCDYIDWKYKKILHRVNNYDNCFKEYLNESKELLDNAYRMRNKQFHGPKDFQLENMVGFLYDIVNDTISFYIDYLDVYKNDTTSCSSLFNIISNINIIKETLIFDEENVIRKISIVHDSIRKM
ncbi:MAG: hypothetical protein J1F35_04230 [Erysipelotrichales bacterium]|nr:hypothetical protein [Erysipelotrichales bacterium]